MIAFFALIKLQHNSFVSFYGIKNFILIPNESEKTGKGLQILFKDIWFVVK